jgi:hypothetical protein
VEDELVTPAFDFNFAEAVKSSTSAIAIDQIDIAHAPAFIFFGGIDGGSIGSPFEFVRQAESLGAHRVFVRDLDQCWYQQGLRGYSDDVASTATVLLELHEYLEPSRRVHVGVSSGAFAAILFGVLTGADEVVAFSPLDSLRLVDRLPRNDRRWERWIKPARQHSKDRRHIDLVRLLKTSQHHTKITVHVGAQDRKDVIAARRLGRIESVEVVAHPGDHTFVRSLRDSGALASLLRDSLG